MLPIVHAFLTDVVEPLGMLHDHIECFRLLVLIVQIFSLGPSGATRHLARAQQAIIDHGELYVSLYPNAVKPKFHHLLHICENVQTLGALLSCFPTERKHRVVKSRALHVFRNFEHTVLRDLVNEQLEKLGEETQYAEVCLVQPQSVKVNGDELSKSTIAHLPCGGVHAGDLVFCTDGLVHQVVGFWESAGNVALQTVPLQNLPDGSWFKSVHRMSFVDAGACICSLAFAKRQRGVFRVVLPLVR